MKSRSDDDPYWSRRGSLHPRARLTDHDVCLIRALAAEGLSSRVMAQKFEVGKSTITRVVNRQSWRHV
jgi:IS30 family transposase